MLGELHLRASTVGLLQCEDELAVTVFEILVDDLKFTFELDRLALPGLQLSRDRWVVSEIAGLGIMRENECAGEQH